MSAAEMIAAAIEKLQALRDASTPGPYGVEDDWQPPQWKDSGWTYVRVVAGEPNPISGIRGMVLSTDGTLPGSEGKARTLANAELIVTLHRTIDPDLEFLRAAAETGISDTAVTNPEQFKGAGAVLYRAAVNLARAILREAS